MILLVKVKWELSQIVIAMASHGYLLLEGGESLIEFVIRNCAMTDDEIAKQDKVYFLQMQFLLIICLERFC
jgi:hypothetical protein